MPENPTIAPPTTWYDRAKANARMQWEMTKGAASAIPLGLANTAKDLWTISKPRLTPQSMAEPELQKVRDSWDNLLLNIPSTVAENVAVTRMQRGAVNPEAPDEAFSDWLYGLGNAVVRKGVGVDELKSYWTGTATTGHRVEFTKSVDPDTGAPKYSPTVAVETTTLSPYERGQQLAGGVLKLAGVLGGAAKLTGRSAALENTAYRAHVRKTGSELISKDAVKRLQGKTTTESTALTPKAIVNETLSRPFVPRLDTLVDDARPAVEGVIEPSNILPARGREPQPRHQPVWYDPDNVVMRTLAEEGELEGFTKRVVAEDLYQRLASVAKDKDITKTSFIAQYVMRNMDPAVSLEWAERTGAPPQTVNMALARGLELHLSDAGRDMKVISELLPHWEETIANVNFQESPTFANLQRLRNFRRQQQGKGAISYEGWGKLRYMLDTFSVLNERSRGIMLVKFATAARNVAVQGGNAWMSALDTAFADMIDKSVGKVAPASEIAKSAPTYIKNQSYLGLALDGLDTAWQVVSDTAHRFPKAGTNPMIEAYLRLRDQLPKLDRSLNGADVYDISMHQRYDSLTQLLDASKPGFNAKEAIKGGIQDFKTNPPLALLDTVTDLGTVFNRGQEAIFQGAHFRSGLEQNIAKLGYKKSSDVPAVTQFTNRWLELEQQIEQQQRQLGSLSGEQKSIATRELADLKDQLAQHQDAIADSYLRAKKDTFAYEPGKDEFGYTLLQLARNDAFTAFINPYPRFMVNQIKWLVDHSPVHFADFFDSKFREQLMSPDYITRREAHKSFSRALTGSILLSGAYAAQDTAAAGPTYNIVKTGKTNTEGFNETLNLQSYNPIDSYALVAKLMHSSVNGEPSNITYANLIDAITNIRRLADIPIFAIDEIIQQIDTKAKKDPDARVTDNKSLMRVIGGWVSRFMVPADYIRQIDGAAREAKSLFTGEDWHQPSDTQKITASNPLWGASLQTLPSNTRPLPDRIDPFTGKPIYPTSSIKDVIAGLHTKYMSPLEEHLQRLGLNSHEYIPRYSNDEAQNEFNTAMGEILQAKSLDGITAANKIITLSQRAKSREEQQKVTLEILKLVKDAAAEQAHARNPKVFLEDTVKRMSGDILPVEKQRLLNQLQQTIPGLRH